jgi:hypothetical protein
MHNWVHNWAGVMLGAWCVGLIEATRFADAGYVTSDSYGRTRGGRIIIRP